MKFRITVYADIEASSIDEAETILCNIADNAGMTVIILNSESTPDDDEDGDQS